MTEELKEQQEATQPIEQPVEQPQVPSPKEEIIANNLAAMRKKIEAAEAKQREAEQRAAEIERYYSSQQQQQLQKPVDDDDGDPEEWVPNKKLKKTTQHLSNQLSEADKKLQALEQKISYFEAKSELDTLKDFNEVVTDENLKTFSRLYPEDYETAISHPSLKAKSKTLYNMIKNYGIAQQSPILKQTEQLKAMEKKIENNKNKAASSAVSSAAPSQNALGKFGRYDDEGRLTLTDADKDRINAEMRKKLGRY